MPRVAENAPSLPGHDHVPSHRPATGRSLRRALAMFAAPWLMAGTGTYGAGPPPATVIQFNTVCARCHEMECSRRLSFGSADDPTHARTHVENHGGPQTPEALAGFRALLEFTKTQCDYYPPAVDPPADGIWSAERLRPLRTPDGRFWFVPLGPAGKGLLRLTLDFSAETEVEAEVIDRDGGNVEVVLPAGDARRLLEVPLARAGLPQYLRLRSREPVLLRELRVRPGIPAGR